MAQWINVHQNSSFVNPIQLPLLCEKTAAITLAQPGFTAGRLAADEMLLHIEILKLYTGQNIEILMAFRKIQYHYSGTNSL